MKRFVTCETAVAITLHARELLRGEEPCYTGRKRKDAVTLCGAEVGWDTNIPLTCVTCSICAKKLSEVS